MAREGTSPFSVCNSNLQTQSPDSGTRGEMHVCGGFRMCQAPPELDYFTFSISVHPLEQDAGGTISILQTGKGVPTELA